MADHEPLPYFMANNPRSNSPILPVAVIVGVLGICAAVAVFALEISPPDTIPTPAAIQPTSTLSSPYQPEIVPLPTHTPGPTQTVTPAPTITPFPTRTPYVLPTFAFYSQPPPDLTVTHISHPICVPGRAGTILEFYIFVRNIGRAGTYYFGSFDVAVDLILGQRHYGLDEWAEQFDGVVGSSDMTISNLDPDEDIKLTVVIDLKGNKSFGIEVTVNAGEKPIREADTTNNTLTEYFSANCY